MCTYNSNASYFNVVLQRIAEEIPVHCFVVVDRFSSDGTVAKILEIFPKAKVVLSNENLGNARKIGIDIVDTQFFAFIDDDVLLLKGWYDYTKALMGDKIGAVACCVQLHPFIRGAYTNATRPRLIVSSRKNMDSQRGFTYATLIRKEACATWKPWSTLAAGEDQEILRHIVKKNFLWLTSYFVFAEHLYDDQDYLTFFRNFYKKTVWNTAGCRYTKLIKLDMGQLIFRTFLGLWTGLKLSLLSRNAFIFVYRCVDSLAFFYGYVCWKRKLFLHR
jgi:glycosyltransferase involved in cell wall biosynthesis